MIANSFKDRRILSVEQLGYAWLEQLLFVPVSFSLLGGQVCHVRGDNGVGKTTLLRLLCGLMQPTIGGFEWEVGFDNPHFFIRPWTYVGHLSGLKRHLTTCENIHFMALQLGVSLNCSALDKILDRLQLTSCRDTWVARLSAGQARRLALARLLLVPAAAWILDEPLNALDASAREILYGLFQEQIYQGGSIILTSHQEVEFAHTPVRHIELKEAS